MKRRTFLKATLGAAMVRPLSAAVRKQDFDRACSLLTQATQEGWLHAASLYVRHGAAQLQHAFGASESPDAMFLIASISKPMSVAALMTLYDQGAFALDDRVIKFLPAFAAEGRDQITIRQLLTHVSGLPDQLPENAMLRGRHADLSEFVEGALRTPLLFSPGKKYSYSSMGILLAAEIAARISGKPFRQYVADAIFRPLAMSHSALGLGGFRLEQMVRCQVEDAAPESGAGDSQAKDWDWNSRYWRELGSPWGGVHASAVDVGRFLASFLHPQSDVLKPETARLMIQNHNPPGLRPRGLGFALGTLTSSTGCSDRTYGHGGSTGTLAWADPATDTICVILTTLPSRAKKPHPRQQVSDYIAKAVS